MRHDEKTTTDGNRATWGIPMKAADLLLATRAKIAHEERRITHYEAAHKAAVARIEEYVRNRAALASDIFLSRASSPTDEYSTAIGRGLSFDAQEQNLARERDQALDGAARHQQKLAEATTWETFLRLGLAAITQAGGDAGEGGFVGTVADLAYFGIVLDEFGAVVTLPTADAADATGVAEEGDA